MIAENMNRREILIIGRNLLLTSMAAGLPLGCSISRSAGEDEWVGKIRPVDGKGTAIVKDLSGPAYTGSGSVSIGDTVPSGAVFTTVAGTRMVLSLPDRSVLQLKDESRLKLDLDSEEGGDLTLQYGALLSVVTNKRRRRSYRIKGAAAQVDVKGTVCFLQTFKPGVKNPAVVPAGATDYFCICNGAIDYLNPAGSKKEMSSSATHHKPYFLYPDGENVGFIESMNLLNHDDREILSLIDRMDGRKHDRHWLEGYKVKY